MAIGRVIGGQYMGAVVNTLGPALVVQAGLRWRKLNPDQVTEWGEVSAGTDTVTAVGKAVAGAVAPRFLSKSASAAVGAALDTVIRPSHTVEVTWADGKQSLIKLPDSLFTHMALLLKDLRAPEPSSALAVPETVTQAEPPTVTEQAFSLVSDIIRERLPRGTLSTTPTDEASATDKPDLTRQLTELAALRDQGILTEEEFSAKKAELLARM